MEWLSSVLVLYSPIQHCYLPRTSVLSPLAALLSLVTEQITLRISWAVCGLLSITLWKTVELVVHATALGKCDLGPSRVPFSAAFPATLACSRYSLHLGGVYSSSSHIACTATHSPHPPPLSNPLTFPRVLGSPSLLYASGVVMTVKY